MTSPAKPTGWNHNTYYYPAVLRAIPNPCERALDIGYGNGTLSFQLARHCGQVIGIDTDAVIPRSINGHSNVTFLAGDVLTYPFAPASFDVVTAIAVLHHLPLGPALQRMRDLLRPGGTLVVIGLYRPTTIADYTQHLFAMLASRILRLTRSHYSPGKAQLRPPNESLQTIREAASAILPGFQLKRRMLFRYSMMWRKPSS